MTRDEILAVVHGVTGNPDTGPVHDVTAGIVDALDAALNPPAPEAAKRDKRVVEAPEVR